MKNKVLSLMLVGTIACTSLIGCASSSENENVKEDTEVATEAGTETGTEVDIETLADDSLPNGTFVRKVKDGYLKEIENADGSSEYNISWGNKEITTTDTKLNLEFSSIPNIGSWREETLEQEDSGVWRYIDNDTWVTVAVWSGGTIPSNSEKFFTIDTSSIEDIKNTLGSMKIYDDTLETSSTDDYASAVFKIERVDDGLSGYAAILDDLETHKRWIVQFLMQTNKADFDMLKASAKSAKIGTDFDYKSLKKESKTSEEPLDIYGQSLYIEDETEENVDNATENN